MNGLSSRHLAALLVACVALAAVTPRSLAQSTSAPEATKGVYLDEPEPVPPPSPVGRTKVQEKYADGAVRVEREVIKMSDDQIINDGQYTEYYPNGEKFSEGKYVKGAHDGAWSFWHDNGQLAKTVTFKNGQADGSWEVRRADGTLESKKGYKNNLRDGQWVLYYDDGKTPKIEQNYVDSKLQGPRKTYYANGKLRQESEFKDGVINGDVSEYNEAGVKVAQATFVDGKLNGKLIRWGTDGSKFEQTFRDNKFTGEQSETKPANDEHAKASPVK